MRLDKKYRIIIEDETSLERKLNMTAKGTGLILLLVACVIIAGAFGIFILASTPMKNYLPGYLRDSERTATEEQHLRLDSLVKVYESNEAYITSVLNALNPSEEKETEIKPERKPNPLAVDSLLPPSIEEKEFMERIRENEKYNITYASPAAAQTMMFGSVNSAAVITEDSKERYQAQIILPKGEPVSTIADGKVISIASSPKSSGGYEVIIQHPKGFLSKSSRLSNLMVKPGDRVAAGQIIAGGTSTMGVKDNFIVFELWHDGDPLLPSRYLNGGIQN